MKRAFVGTIVLLLVGALLAGAIVGGFLIPRPERIASMQVQAVAHPDGDVSVLETIRWDYDTNGRRGIIRDIPYEPPAGRSGRVDVTEVGVASPSAPDDFDLSPGFRQLEIKVGDPDITIYGEHDYRIAYRLEALGDDDPDGARIELDVIGTDWEVPIDDAKVELTVPGPLVEATCTFGDPGSTRRCSLDRVDNGDGTSTVSSSGLSLPTGHGVSLRVIYETDVAQRPPLEIFDDATFAAEAATPPGVDDLDGPSGLEVGDGIVAFAVGFPLLLAAGAGATWAGVRRVGRDERYAGEATDAAFGGTGVGTVTVSERDAADLVTISFWPPKGVRPGEGGTLLRLRARVDDRVATLVDLAVRGWLQIDETDERSPRLLAREGSDQLEDWEQAFRDGFFSKTNDLELGTYQPEFSAAWDALGKALDRRLIDRGWLREDHLRRRVLVGLPGTLVILAALALGAGAAFWRWPAEWSAGWLALLPLGLVFGLGIGLRMAAAGTRARSAPGFATWTQVEGFRRFLAESEGEHAREAARRGYLREFVAWAVAVGEVDRWDQACRQANLNPTEGWMLGDHTRLAPSLHTLTRGTQSAATAPSSSSSSGGGGGSVGGGGGGGGGRSW